MSLLIGQVSQNAVIHRRYSDLEEQIISWKTFLYRITFFFFFNTEILFQRFHTTVRKFPSSYIVYSNTMET